MLEELTIQNYALIEKAHVIFQSGFNVLTGETGAGKSILIGALGLLLGSRADSEIIRAGADEAVVSGVISPGRNPDCDAWLAANGLSLEDGTLLLRRIVRPQKRGSCYLSSTLVTRNQLEDLTSFLIDLHGQHEHQSLFSSDQQRKLLDRYAQLETDLDDFSKEFQELSRRKKEWEALLVAASARDSEMERLKFQIAEIRKVNPQSGEQEELKAEKGRLEQHERLWSALSTLKASLTDDRDSVLSLLKQARAAFKIVAEIDSDWQAPLGRYEAAFYELEDLAESLASYRRGLQFRPERLEEINERLGELHGLEKRYGPGVESVLEALETAEARLGSLENSEVELERLENLVAEQERLVIQKAMILSDRRQAAARILESEIVQALADLGMSKARFQIDIKRRTGETGKPLCSVWGLDQVEFSWAANHGEPIQPLRDTASGGELSRVMLAMKTILSDADNIPILIFDEIDTGIGGEIGQALGRYLKRLSRRKQVLCITHLASIAAYADHHLRIEKHQEGERTLTVVDVVKGEDRVQEIARMLSGGSSSAGIEHARELIAGNLDRE